MGIGIIDNFSLSHTKFLDGRQSYPTLTALQNDNTTKMPKGMEVFIEDIEKWYVMSCTDVNDPTTYVWTERPSGGGASSFSELTGDPMDNTALASALNEKADADEVYTKTETDNGFLSSTVYQQDKENYMVYTCPSTNLFDKANMIDKKLINFSMGSASKSFLGNYDTSILSGFVPVEEGKTYIVASGTTTNLGCLAFTDIDYKGLCACQATNPQSYYGTANNHWPLVTDKVNVTYNSSNNSNTFTVLEGSGIRYVLFYIKKRGVGDNYWGAHEDLSVVDDTYPIQMNEGDVLLPYEKYGPQTIVKYEEADAHLALQVDDKIDNLQEKLEDEIDTVAGNPKLTLTMSNNGASWAVESNIFDQTGGLHIAKLTGDTQANRTNHLFEFGSHYIDNVSIKGDSDDITPVNGSSPGRWSGTYIGANHGQSNGYTLTFDEPHGKDNSDIGSIWAMGNRQYTIYEVPSETTVRIINTLYTPSTTGGTLTHVSGATHDEDMTYTSATMDQMYRAVNKQTIHIYDANWKEIPHDANGVYKSDKFRFVQCYQILNPDSAVQHLQELRADGQIATRDNLHDEIVSPFVRHSLCYEISEGCACTLYQSSDFLDDFSGMHGFVQSGCMSGTPSTESPEEVYIAGFRDNTPFNIVGTEGSIAFSRAEWTNSNNPPHRYYQFKANDKSVGFMQGFYTKIGLGIPEVRNARNGDSVGFIYKTGKMYPYAYSGQTFHDGDHIEGVAFYSPFVMDTSDNCYAAVYNYVYDDIILAIDYQEAADVLFRLKNDCIGKHIEVLDKTDTCIMDREMANGETLPITFTGKGYIVLRFYSSNDPKKEFVAINQGIENAGKLLKVDETGKVTPILVGGLSVDSELSTTSINPVENRVITNYVQTAQTNYQSDRSNFIVNHHVCTNLFDKSLMIDRKLLSYDGLLSPYDTSILSGFVPVEEGKTYTVKGSPGANCGALCFVTDESHRVCGCQAYDPAQPYGLTDNHWPSIDGFVTCSYNSADKTNTFTVLEGSNINYLIFYIKKKNSESNYWGAHEDLSVIDETYTIQMNEGDTLLPYEAYYTPYDTAKYADDDEVINENLSNLETTVTNHITEYQDTKDRFICYDRPSTNLFDLSIIRNHTLLNFATGTTPESFVNKNFATGITACLSVEEGKTYITNNKYLVNSVYYDVGCLCFANENKVGVCSCIATDVTKAYGEGSGSPGANWPRIDGYVTASYDSTTKSNTFTILEGSGIRYVYFFVKGAGTSGNYWGDFTDEQLIEKLKDYELQINEGSSIMPYEPGGIITESRCVLRNTNISFANSTATDITTLVSDFNSLLDVLRIRNIIAPSV